MEGRYGLFWNPEKIIKMLNDLYSVKLNSLNLIPFPNQNHSIFLPPVFKHNYSKEVLNF